MCVSQPPDCVSPSGGWLIDVDDDGDPHTLVGQLLIVTHRWLVGGVDYDGDTHTGWSLLVVTHTLVGPCWW